MQMAIRSLEKLKMIFFNNDTSMGQIKNSESPTGIEPMASQIPIGRSNQLMQLVILILLFLFHPRF